MQRLIYTLEPMSGARTRAIGEDAIVGITMAALGIHGIHKEVGGPAHAPRVCVTFPDERATAAFNLRIERTLALRGVKITKIQVDPTAPTTARAVA